MRKISCIPSTCLLLIVFLIISPFYVGTLVTKKTSSNLIWKNVVCDNLNTHTIGALYAIFSPQEALKLAKRLEIHHTPKHGSWLNIAEIELSAITQQCLNRRIGLMDIFKHKVEMWQSKRNRDQKSVNWQFRSEDARVKLHQPYPQI